ncbi:permease prefix domain 1-containing protein [Deinococcus petrolearius]|uniref:Permease prefix domain 1-containing protein n=1 Tax=Deinococcus petrolearius TaxID=1751295 RepID=A0ABW1DQK4_9DEIO
MKALEQYVATATRGLPQRERQRVAEELRANVLERVAEHQIPGKSRSEALRLALQEFGDPQPLAAGMRGIYLWPQLGIGGAAASLLLVAMFTVRAVSATPHITVTTQGQLARCEPEGGIATGGLCSTQRRFWVDQADLRAQLLAQGATLKSAQQQVNENRWAPQPLTVSWEDTPGRQGQFFLPADDGLEDRSSRQRAANFPDETVIRRGGKTFLSSELLFGAIFESSTLPLRIERPLDAPVVHIGRLRLEFGQPGQGGSVGWLVENAVTRLLTQQFQASVFRGENLLPRWEYVLDRAKGHPQAVKVSGRSSEIYAVVRPVSANGVNGLGFDLATVDSNGILKFRTAQKSVTLTQDIKALANGGSLKAKIALINLGPAILLSKKGFIYYKIDAVNS